MDRPEPLDLIAFLAPYPVGVQRIALDARLILLEMLEPVSEIFWDACSAVCSGFTYTDSVADNFVNLAVYSNHVTLILPWGVDLDDPEKRLRGEGKRVRNLRLASAEALHDPYVARLVEKAASQAKRPTSPVEPRWIAKVMSGPKRRPIG